MYMMSRHKKAKTHIQAIAQCQYRQHKQRALMRKVKMYNINIYHGNLTKFLLPRWNSFRLQLFQNFLQSPELVDKTFWKDVSFQSLFQTKSLQNKAIEQFTQKIKQKLLKFWDFCV